jgi:hypothetical protein
MGGWGSVGDDLDLSGDVLFLFSILLTRGGGTDCASAYRARHTRNRRHLGLLFFFEMMLGSRHAYELRKWGWGGGRSHSVQ